MIARHRLALAAALSAALTLSACGVTPYSGVRPRPATTIGAKDAKAAELLKGLRATDAQLKTLSATASFWETDGQKQGDHAAEIVIAKPGQIGAKITKSTDAMKRGVKLVYLNDGKVRAKLGFIKKTFDYTDSTVTSLRGWRIDQTNFESIVAGILHPQASVKALGPTTVGGHAAQLLEVVSPGMLPGATKQVVALDAKRHVPLKLEVYDGTKVVYRLELTNVQLNPQLPKDAFKL